MIKSLFVTQAIVERHIMNMRSVLPDSTFSITKLPGGNGHRFNRQVDVDGVSVTMFGVDYGEVKPDEFMRAKYELLAFIQGGCSVVKHFEPYFSVWDPAREVPDKIIERHYKEQASRFFSGVYVYGDNFALYSRTTMHVERTLPGGDMLSFTFVRREDILAYLQGAFKPDNLKHTKRLIDFEDAFPELLSLAESV